MEDQVIDYRKKYEKLVRETLKEIEGTVKKAQRRAEETSRDQLTASEKRERELERALEETRTRLRKVEKQISLHEHGDELLQKRVHCLQTLCCLTVTVRMDGEKTIYSCTVDDGQLMGHTFELTLDSERWEYMYNPTAPAEYLPANSDLCRKILFPDYMMPRFLRKLLTETYKNSDEFI